MKYYCEELFVVWHKTQHSCESAIYFDLGADIIKDNCEFQYYFKRTDVKPSVLDGRHKIILANWPNTKYMICNDNQNFPIKIASHPFVSLKRAVLCNCAIEAENNFLLESIAMPAQQNNQLYLCIIQITQHLCIILIVWYKIQKQKIWMYIFLKTQTTQEQVFPVSLQTFEFDTKLLKAPKTLKDLAQQYKQKGHTTLELNKDNTKHLFFNRHYNGYLSIYSSYYFHDGYSCNYSFYMQAI